MKKARGIFASFKTAVLEENEEKKKRRARVLDSRAPSQLGELIRKTSAGGGKWKVGREEAATSFFSFPSPATLLPRAAKTERTDSDYSETTRQTSTTRAVGARARALLRHCDRNYDTLPPSLFRRNL